MHFLSPLNLLWALPISGLIIVMYILKLRRKDVIVSSTFLWSQVIRDVQANAPFQKLRRNLLLFLQLIAAAALIFALARPFIRARGLGGRNIVLIVDTSASMSAVDVAPNRLEVAKRIASDRIAALGPGDQMMVVSAADRPRAMTGFTSEHSELRRAVAGLKAGDTSTNMRDALNLAADLAASRNQDTPGVIDLISDGAFESTDPSAGTGPSMLSNLNLGRAHLQFYPIGVGHNNVGLTAVDVRRNLGEERTVQLLAVTHNFSDQPKTFTEEIYSDDNLIDAHEVDLPAGGENTEPYDIPEPDNPVRMRVNLDLKDDLAADNHAFLILKPRKTLHVLLVGADNVFLTSALKVDPSVELSRTDAFSSGKGFDVVIFNDSAPKTLPAGNYLFLHCASDRAPVTLEGSQDNVGIADWERDSPVLRYVDFGQDRFGSCLKASTKDWGRELAVGDSGVVVASGQQGDARSVFVGFSLSQSMFPLRVAFPILIANSVRWLGTGSDDSELSQIPTGSTITIPTPANVSRVTVTRPDGSKLPATAGQHGAPFDATDEAGFYTVSGSNFSYEFAANLSSATESDTTPHRQLTLLDNPTAGQGRSVVENRDLIPWFVLLALAVLCVEWWAFHRRVYVS